MIESAAKILVGTLLYVAVLWAARRNPRAAGMMLTFPTLNGITMVVTQPSELGPIVGTMLLIPFVNGFFCAIFLSGFGRVVRAGSAPAAASGLLLAAITGVWLVVAWLISRGAWSVPAPDRTIYALAAAVGGLLLTWVWPAHFAKAPRASAPPALRQLLHRNRIRIVLFAIALAIVLIVDKLDYSPALLGVLAALPLIPFFSLHTIATDTELSPDARGEELAAMANGVWLGPAIAIAFIVGFWRWLAALAAHVDGTGYLAVGVPSLLVGWGLCIAAIWACERVLRRMKA
jgi:hypothetical protein